MDGDVMTATVELDDLQLGALLCSRLCHDVIGPVGAISNGFEILEDEKDESMRQMALDLIRTNASKASARLQFARLAFGAMGAAADRFPLEEARKLTEGLFDKEKVSIVWAPTADALFKDHVKLLVNLVLIAAQAIPRGGNVAVEVTPDSDGATFRLVSTGINAGIPKTASAIFEGNAPDGRIDAHSIQPYYAARLARLVGMEVSFRALDGAVEIGAAKAA